MVAACSKPLPNTDWSTYLADNTRSNYSDLEQINRSNVHELRTAWIYDSGELQDGASVMHTSPLVIEGVLYGLSPRLSPFAVNATNGQEFWRRTDLSTNQSTIQKNLLWLEREDQQQLILTSGTQLMALNPQNGETLFSIDLTSYITANSSIHDSPKLFFKDLIIIGIGKYLIAVGPDGEVVWRNPVGTSVSGLSADTKRGWIYVATDSPDPPHDLSNREDGHTNSVLAMDALSGAIQWNFRNIENDLWDRGFKTYPTLIGDSTLSIVAATGDLLLLDRDTGQPLVPLKKIEPPPDDRTEDQSSSFQWLSSIELTRQNFEITNRNTRSQEVVTNSLADVDLRRLAFPSVQGGLLFPGYPPKAGWNTAYDPTTNQLFINTQEVAGVMEMLQIPVGFSEQDEYMLHCARCHGVDRKGLYAGRDARYGAGGPSLVNVSERLSARDIEAAIRLGRGSMPKIEAATEISRRAITNYLLTGDRDLATNPRTTETSVIFSGPKVLRDSDGLPGNSPPWGTLNAVNIETKELRWKTPLGDYPGYSGSNWGSENIGSPMVTKSGIVFMAGTPDMKIRAFDSKDGAILWESDLPAAAYSSPITYRIEGKQYLVIGTGGGALGPPSGSEYVAFTLP